MSSSGLLRHLRTLFASPEARPVSRPHSRMGGGKHKGAKETGVKRKRPKKDSATAASDGGNIAIEAAARRKRKQHKLKGTVVSKTIQSRNQQVSGLSAVSSNWQSLASVCACTRARALPHDLLI